MIDEDDFWRNWWNEDWQGKPKYSEKTCPNATSSTTNATWLDLGSNPGHRSGKPTTNRLSYGTALQMCVSCDPPVLSCDDILVEYIPICVYFYIFMYLFSRWCETNPLVPWPQAGPLYHIRDIDERVKHWWNKNYVEEKRNICCPLLESNLNSSFM
jgi:hypothetical protein